MKSNASDRIDRIDRINCRKRGGRASRGNSAVLGRKRGILSMFAEGSRNTLDLPVYVVYPVRRLQWRPNSKEIGGVLRTGYGPDRPHITRCKVGGGVVSRLTFSYCRSIRSVSGPREGLK